MGKLTRGMLAMPAGLLVLGLFSCGGSATAVNRSDAAADGDAPGSAAGNGGQRSGTGGAISPGSGGQGLGTGGASSPGSGGEGTAGAGSPGGGDSGGAAGAAAGVPAADISGRWAMFTFEDPVGVELSEASDGTLTGTGCASGAPGMIGAAQNENRPNSCGGLSGRVTGQTASFVFASYRVQVTISSDGRRMTGALETSVADFPFPVAWLRVPSDALWLERPRLPEADPRTGNYDLALDADASVGGEFVAGTPYALLYWEGAVGGHLGSFWSSEISDTSVASPLRVGPVPATVPQLPISLDLDFDSTGFTGVTARTASGGRYHFTARKRGL